MQLTAKLQAQHVQLWVCVFVQNQFAGRQIAADAGQEWVRAKLPENLTAYNKDYNFHRQQLNAVINTFV